MDASTNPGPPPPGPTSLDTVGALTQHAPQAELPGIRATIAFAQTIAVQGVAEPVHAFNQRQKAYIRKRHKRLDNDTHLIELCAASGHPVVRAYGKAMAVCAGGGIQVAETPSGALLLRRDGTRCNKSHCAECRHINNQAFIKKMTPELERVLSDKNTRLRFAVLTLPNCPNTPEALSASIKAAQAAMTKLRRQRWFKAATFGTIETFEYTISPNVETGDLNPHINVLIAGPAGSDGYIEQKQLSDEWCKLTGAYIVHIQEALQGAKMQVATALNEVLKYIAKGMEFTTAQDVETLIIGTTGKRLRRTTGIFYGLDNDATEQEQAEAETGEQTAQAEAVVSKEDVQKAVTLAVIPLAEIELLYAMLDAGVRLAPAFHYAATGELPITALVMPRPPGYH